MTPKTLRKERREKFIIILSKYYMGINDGVLNELLDAAESRSEVRGIEAAIFADRPVTDEDMGEKIIREACNEFESALGFGALPWDSTANWTELRKFVVKLYQSDPQEFRKFEAWRRDAGKYQGCTNKSIRENPAMFKDTHYPTFKAHTAMYKTDEVRPEYKPYKPEEGNYVPAPRPSRK